jgi:hypothetical protein
LTGLKKTVPAMHGIRAIRVRASEVPLYMVPLVKKAYAGLLETEHLQPL